MVIISEKEIEIEAKEKLKLIDISKAEGKVIFHMFNVGECFVQDIEKATDLRQPEVCIASKKLTERGWIKSTPHKKNTGKGRPLLRYSLAMRKGDILKAINKMFSEKVKAMEKAKDDFNALMESLSKEQVKS